MSMSMRFNRPAIVVAGVVAAALVACAHGTDGAGAGRAGFFVTSVGSGHGADLGGLAGADQHCGKLAAAAGLPARDWRAYLSTQGKDGVPTVNARDRIGRGPWHNVKGALIARDLHDLHGAGNRVSKLTALNERGEQVSGRGDTPNRHDILTGTRPDGTAFSMGDPDMTCGNWTRGGAEGVAVVGHHDRMGPTDDPWAVSWNSSHQSRGGCSPQALMSTGGEGLLYCFAAD